jgi:hypothetical protein
LKKTNTRPILQNERAKSVTNWLSGHETHLFERQKRIGVYRLLRGYIGKEWVEEQQQYFYGKDNDGHNRSFDSGIKRTTYLVIHLWKCNHDLWNNNNKAIYSPANIRNIMAMGDERK